MAQAPLVTVTELLFEALGRPRGSPPAWPGVVREALQPQDLAVLGPVYSPGGPLFVPDCLVPRATTFVTSSDDELEKVIDVSVDDLVAELDAEDQLDATWAQSPRHLGAGSTLT